MNNTNLTFMQAPRNGWMDGWMEGGMDVCMHVCMHYGLHCHYRLEAALSKNEKDEMDKGLLDSALPLFIVPLSPSLHLPSTP